MTSVERRESKRDNKVETVTFEQALGGGKRLDSFRILQQNYPQILLSFLSSLDRTSS